jgi:RimJ/RimL family protein N-acetyltransferase
MEQRTDAFTYTFPTKSGLLVGIRPTCPEDTHHLVNLFDHLSPASRYQRFNDPLENVTPEQVWREAERLAKMEPEQGVLWLAFVDLPNQPGAPVAGLRLHHIPPGAAEVAISVRDDMQGEGIANGLIQFLLQEASARGIHKLIALFHSDNLAVKTLLQRSPVPLLQVSHGNYIYIEADLSKTAH